MLNQPTMEKLHTMKLHGMADAFCAQLETADEPAQVRGALRHARRSTVALEGESRAGATPAIARLKEHGVIEDIGSAERQRAP